MPKRQLGAVYATSFEDAWAKGCDRAAKTGHDWFIVTVPDPTGRRPHRFRVFPDLPEGAKNWQQCGVDGVVRDRGEWFDELKQPRPKPH